MQGSNIPPQTIETAETLAKLLISHEGRITDAISTGAQWEIWLQVEFLLWIRDEGSARREDWSAARELPYPKGKKEISPERT
jgi:hypothetical protein